MPEGRGLWGRLSALAVAVLALHLWLLGGMPRNTAPLRAPASWLARTVPAPVSAPAPAAVAALPQPPSAAAPREPVRPAPRTAPPRGERARNTAPARAPSPGTPATLFVVAPSARLHYAVTAQSHGLTLHGTAELQWRHDGREYEAQLELSSPLVRTRTQRSTGLVTPQGLAPLRFSDKYRSEEATHFERDSGKVVFSSNRPEAVLEAGGQDRLSVVMQLGAMLAGNPAGFPPGSSISIQTASTHEAEPWSFTVEGPEDLRLPGGSVGTVKLTRNPRKDYDVKVELWLAPGQAYVPVRLRLTQPNGDWVDQQWSSTDRG